MTPIAIAAAGAAALGLGYVAYRKSQGLPVIPRSSSLPSAFAPSPYTPPLLGPQVNGLQVGDVVLARVPQPNQSLADLDVEITGLLGNGMYAVRPRPDLDGTKPEWGIVYPTQVGDADIIRKDGPSASVSGLIGLNPQPLPPRYRYGGNDPALRYRLRQTALSRALGERYNRPAR